jgi:hypothetical protein
MASKDLHIRVYNLCDSYGQYSNVIDGFAKKEIIQMINE